MNFYANGQPVNTKVHAEYTYALINDGIESLELKAGYTKTRNGWEEVYLTSDGWNTHIPFTNGYNVTLLNPGDNSKMIEEKFNR